MPSQVVVGLVLILHVIVAAVIGYDAQRRGREPLPWSLLVLFAPGIGHIAYVFFVLVPPRAARHTEIDGAGKPTPKSAPKRA